MTRKYLVGFLSVLAGLNLSCSTPTLHDVDPEPQETAWYAYQECLRSIPREANRSACDDVGSLRAESNYYYTGMADTSQVGWPQGGYVESGYPGFSGNYFVGGTGTGFSTTAPTTGSTSPQFRGYKANRLPAEYSLRVQLDQAYHEYLKSLDADTLAELTARWQELSLQ